jgi:hypothetical protein
VGKAATKPTSSVQVTDGKEFGKLAAKNTAGKISRVLAIQHMIQGLSSITP